MKSFLPDTNTRHRKTVTIKYLVENIIIKLSGLTHCLTFSSQLKQYNSNSFKKSLPSESSLHNDPPFIVDQSSISLKLLM